MIRRAAIAAAWALATLLVAGPFARAQDLPETDSSQPVLFTADELEYDDTLGVVTARGNVELTQDNRTVLADTLVYDQVNDLVTAQGNVAVLEPTGEVLFTDYAELTGNLRNAVIANLGILLSDNARLAANLARRSHEGTRTELAQAVYSPCDVCAENPTPLWQIKADNVVYDQTDETVRYRDATLEFLGVPLLYTPYLQHPGPNIKRQSGVLAPTFGSTSNLGGYIRLPVYIVIDDQSDATIEPYFTTDEGLALVGEYRQRFTFGQLYAHASGTIVDRDEGDGIVKENSFRGHLDATGIYSIDENWRAGHDIELSADDTYRRIYGFNSPTILTSNAYAEGFYGRSYARADIYAFRDQRASSEDNNDTPTVFPELQASYVSQPNDFGAFWTVDASSRVLFRQEGGSDNARLSLGGSWRVPYVSSVGELVDLSLSLRGDLYYIRDYVDPGSGEEVDNSYVGRLFPQAAVTWRWPLVKYAPPYQIVMEPMAGIVLSPFGNNPEDVPDEDSRGFEIDASNLFDGNRFPGYDRVEGGQRINYGMNFAVYGEQGGYSSLFLGQSLRLRDDEAFLSGSGVEDELSDLVGRIEIEPIGNLRLVDRFRFDLESKELTAHDVTLSAGPPALRLSAQYVFVEASERSGESDDREELSGVLSSQIDDYWRINARLRYDLNEGSTRVAGFGLLYEDECFLIAGDFQRSFYQDRDLQPDDSLTFRIGLKTLGEITL